MSIAQKLEQIAQNQQAVYDAGFSDGQAQGGGGSYDQGYTDGKQAEYDRFWDNYQDSGNRTDYQNAFCGQGWTNETFKPKYNMKVSKAYMMFRACRIEDLREEAIGLSMDFSECKEFHYGFAYCGAYLKHLPTIDVSSATALTSTFSSYAGTDLSLIVSETTGFHTSTFDGVTKLVNLAISGTIGVSLNLKSTAVLSNASVQNIIDCLKDLTGATAQTLTLNTAVVANMTPEQKTAISAKNWTLAS